MVYLEIKSHGYNCPVNFKWKAISRCLCHKLFSVSASKLNTPSSAWMQVKTWHKLEAHIYATKTKIYAFWQISIIFFKKHQDGFLKMLVFFHKPNWELIEAVTSPYVTLYLLRIVYLFHPKYITTAYYGIHHQHHSSSSEHLWCNKHYPSPFWYHFFQFWHEFESSITLVTYRLAFLDLHQCPVVTLRKSGYICLSM